MSEEKTKSQKRQTKAGMLEKNNKQTASTGKKDKASSNKSFEDTPKISKEKAEERNDDKPIH